MSDAKALRPILASPDVVRQAIRDRVTEAVRGRFPIRGRRFSAELTRLGVKEADVSPERQKELRLSGGNASEGVYGDIAVKDEDGNVVATLTNHRLLNIPWYTPRHTLLLDGNEYAVVNQMRTKPGVYTRKRGNDEIESSFNLSKGANFKLVMDPGTGVFTLDLLGARIPAYAALRILGAGKDDVLRVLGRELYEANAGLSPARMDRARDTLHDKLVRGRNESDAPVDAAEKDARIRAYFSGTGIDPETTRITLGTAYNAVSARTILDAMAKILSVYRGEEDVDERDHLEFQKILGVEDLLKEVIDKAPELTDKIRNKLDGLGAHPTPAEVKAAFSPALFSKPLRAFITTSSLSRLPAQTNPAEFADGASTITRLGEGAISSERAVPFETRGVNLSYLGLIDPIAAPESSKVGIDVRAARSAMKGGDNEFYRRLFNCRMNRMETVRAIETFDKRLGFPDPLYVTQRKPDDIVPAAHKGKLIKIPRRDLDYQIPSPHDLTTSTTNTLPFANANQGNRLVMGDKHIQQALPLKEPDTRLVKPVMRDAPGNGTLRSLADQTIPRAPVDGVVTDITDGRITVKSADGVLNRVDFATWLPLAGKTFLHNALLVKPGDPVKAGQALADSNFSRDGELALGRNLSVAYMPYMGLNHEDGIVLSQSAAEKMTSVHAVTLTLRLDKTMSTGRERYAAAFPTAFASAQLGRLDEDGVARKGAVLEEGDPVILALEDNGESRVNQVLGLLHKSLAHPWRDAAQIWEEHHPGEVVAVHKGQSRIAVVLKMEKPLEQGDKLAGSYGNKGVCSKILPDDAMPRDEAGKPVDAVFTSAGVISRINPAQILESALGKVALKRGKPYEIESFSHPDYVSYVKAELRKNGVKDKETLTDPITGKTIPGVFVGVQHCHKLFKTTGTNYAARGVEGPHDQDDTPTGSGDSGPKALGSMEVNALLAHNARTLLREGTSLRGSKNLDFWKAFQEGRSPNFPAQKKTFDRFTAILKQAGINVSRHGDELAAGPLTDHDVLALSSGEILDAKRLKAKTLEPEDGGLFDPTVTGGLKGDRWGHVTLAEPVINPVFNDAARTLLDLSGPALRGLYAREGGQTLRHRLNAIDVEAELKKQENALETGGLSRSALDAAVKKIKLLRALKEQGLKPGDAYILSVAPVTPPLARPVTVGTSGDIMDNDANLLYRDLILTNNSFKKVRNAGLGDGVLRENRLALQDRMSELAGMLAPTGPHLRNRGIKGALDAIAGDTPKQGYFQHKVIYNKTNLSGRATITPDVTLGLDEVGLSEKAAWEMYAPFIIRGLSQTGYSPLQAREAVAQRTPAARDLLLRELDKRPVIINRAPTLWRHGIMAARPLLRPGNNLHVNSLWEKSLNADYDGDAMQIHLPVSDEAIDEAKQMFPSRQLFSDKKSGDLLQMPTREPIIGLYKATANVGAPSGGDRPRRFASEIEAWQAYYKGALKMTDYVEIG